MYHPGPRAERSNNKDRFRYVRKKPESNFRFFLKFQEFSVRIYEKRGFYYILHMRLLFIILTACIVCNANDKVCYSLYNDFMDALEPQVTEICRVGENIFSYRFYVKDEDTGYTNMDLVFWETGSHLYIEGDFNPFVCDKETAIYRTQKPEEIARILFIPRTDCTPQFKESIGIVF